MAGVSPETKDTKPKRSWKQLRGLTHTHKALGKSVRKMERATVRHAKRFVTGRLDRISAVRRAVFGWAALVVLLIAVSVVQWASFRQTYTADAAAAGGTYSEGTLGPLETLNPIFARTSAEKSAARLLFASLYYYDETGHLKGDLATAMEIDETQMTYTVTMRKDAKWSDGAPLTVDDVIFTIELLKNPATRSELSGWSVFNVEKVDSSKVTFTLPSAYAPFMHALTFPILPQHILKDVDPAELREQGFSRAPVTSGPFAFRLMQNITPDGSKKVVHMAANPTYHLGAPRLERFQLYAYNTRADIERALMMNEIIATPELVYDGLSEQVKRKYMSKNYSINDGVFALFNTKSELLQHQAIRQALALTVDRADLMTKLTRPATPLTGPILPIHVDGLPVADGFDPDKAKGVLDEAGWKITGDVRVKDGQELTLNMVALKGSDFGQIAEALAQTWRKELQIKVDVRIVDPIDPAQSVLQTILQPRDFDVLLYELVMGGDPDVYAYWHSSQANPNGLNFSNYSNVIADDALSSGRALIDEKHRADRYQAFTRRWMADVPAAALYQPKIDYVYASSVQSMNDSATLVFPEDRYANVIYWSVGTTTVFRTP